MTLRWIHEKPSPHEIWTITCGLLSLLSSFEMSISKAFVFLGFICKFVHRFSSYLTSLKIKEATHNQTVQWALVWWGQSQGLPGFKSSFGYTCTDFHVWRGKDLKRLHDYADSVLGIQDPTQGPKFCLNDNILSLVVVGVISSQLHHSTTRVNFILENFKTCQWIPVKIACSLRFWPFWGTWHLNPFFRSCTLFTNSIAAMDMHFICWSL